VLGSVEGNLHFLLGYGNPKFHLAPYHLQIIDPNMTDEDLAQHQLEHPSEPTLWAKFGTELGDEGDTDEGQPHTQAKQAKQKQAVEERRASEAITVDSGAGRYQCIPSEQLVFGEHNNHVYRWDLIKDSFFSAMHPEVVEAMDSAEVQKSLSGMKYKSTYPDTVRARAREFRGELFDADVWPLLKSRMPRPGHVVSFESEQGESVFGVVTPTSLEFYTRGGEPAQLPVYDRVYKSFDLVKDGNVHPGVLLHLAVKHFNVNKNLLDEVRKSSYVPSAPVQHFVEGEPSPGWDNVEDDVSLVKSVVMDGDTFRVIVEVSE
jgi:hypothetical protein